MPWFRYVGNDFPYDGTSYINMYDINYVVRLIKIGQTIELSSEQEADIEDGFMFDPTDGPGGDPAPPANQFTEVLWDELGYGLVRAAGGERLPVPAGVAFNTVPVGTYVLQKNSNGTWTPVATGGGGGGGTDDGEID